jgi:HEAT repeat protein
MNRTLLTVAGVLLAVTIAVYAVMYFFGGDRPIPPDELAKRALTAANPADREKAARLLAESGQAGIPHMREVVAKTDSPEIKSDLIQGLGAAKDWRSMPVLLDALGDANERIRARAGVAVTDMLGVDYLFRAQDPPDKREAIAKIMRKRYESMLKNPPPFAKGSPP